MRIFLYKKGVKKWSNFPNVCEYEKNVVISWVFFKYSQLQRLWVSSLIQISLCSGSFT